MSVEEFYPIPFYRDDLQWPIQLLLACMWMSVLFLVIPLLVNCASQEEEEEETLV